MGGYVIYLPIFLQKIIQSICVLVNYRYLCDMEKVLELYKYIDGTNDVAFPSVEQQVITSDFRYDVKRMGGAPMITCTIKHELCLDKLWTDNVYAMFNGERFFIKQVPTSSYDNTDCRYKHEVELVSERIILDNVYFYDVVDSGASYDKPVSNSSNFTFFGDIHQFVARMNESLSYSKVGYSVVVDSGISSEDKQVSFQDQFFSNVLQEIYNTYELPYYFDKKVIHVGYTSNAITHTMKYGRDESLLSIQRQNANYKIVNRVTGVGSADNIPYYYPNDYESKEEVEANGGTWINPQTNLMPPIYRSSFGSERFYNAMNGVYVSPETGDYYTFDNPYVVGKPKEHIVNFEDIKPSIKGMTNASGYRIDMFTDFAYDANDNDDMDEEGNYIHPYFFAKLRKFDGANGFNLFDHAIDEGEMTIAMTSGSLGACEFVIGVDEDSQKNPVQVDENGNLERDDDGNVVRSGTPQDRQNDTQNNEVWIALRKDIETFGVIMPNASSNYKPSTNDTFVILHIDLPKAYILAAEEKLKDELIKYMALNNDEKFNFSITFSRIFFAENPAILEQLDENARVQVEYDDERYELYVSSYSYTMSSDQVLPEVRVELSDTLTISQNALQLAISEVKHDIMTSFGGGDFLKQGLKYFLRKDVDDRSRGTISSDKGFVVGKFVTGTLGSGASMYQDKEKNSYIEADYLKIRKKATFTNITVQELKHVGGEIILSHAAMICSKVEELETGYKCYFNKEDSDGRRVYQEFEVDDQARCQTFNLERQADGTLGNHYFWRLVIEIGEDYIVLSKTDCDANSDIPLEGDHISLLGNRSDAQRQNAILLSAYGSDAPSYKQYRGIKSYVLADAELVTKFSPEENILKGTFILESGKNVEDELEDVKVNWDKVLSQTDKEFTMWFYPYSPNANNLPESEWVTDELKALHEEDLFYNTSVDDEDGGKAWRYVYDEASGTYLWEIVTDAETIKALEKASEAQKTADSKCRNFLSQPTPPYDYGDRWSNATYGTLYDDDDLVCINPKAEGQSFSINDWQPVAYGTTSTIKALDDRIILESKRIDETETSISQLSVKFDEIEASVVENRGSIAENKTLAEAAKAQAVTATMTGMYSGEEYNQTTNPWTNWAGGTEYKHVGAIWYNPNTGVTQRYIGTDNSNTWETVSNAATVYASATYVFQNKNKWSAIATKFDSNGNPTSTSGFVTSSNFAAMFSEQWNGNETVRAEIGTFVTKDANGNLSSNVKITADNVDINNGVLSIDKDSAIIGGFQVTSNSLTNWYADTSSGASIYISNSAQTRFAKLNGFEGSTTSAEFRNDTGTAVVITAYGSSDNYGLKIVGNQSSKALHVTGSSYFVTRRSNSEFTYVSGLKVCARTGYSLTASTNSSDPYFPSGAQVDFLILSGALSLPDPSTCRGKIYFIKRRGAGSNKLTVPNCYLADGDYNSSAEWAGDDDSRIFISDGVYWNEFYCG